MKSITFILLAVLALATLTPIVSFTFVMHDGLPLLGNLDVCHSSAPALSADGELPCLSQATCTAEPIVSIAFSEPVQPVFPELILAGNSEHPPRS